MSLGGGIMYAGVVKEANFCSKFKNGKVIWKLEVINFAKQWAATAFPNRKILDFGIFANDLNFEDVQAGGDAELHDAFISYVRSNFDVHLSKSIGTEKFSSTQAAIGAVFNSVVRAGDVIITTIPSARDWGGQAQLELVDIVGLPLRFSNSFFPDLDSIPKSLLERSKMMLINYPNVPTGACATREFFRKLICFATDRSLLIINDASSARFASGDKTQISIFSVEGAEKVAVETHCAPSPSQANFFLCGDRKLLKKFVENNARNNAGGLEIFLKSDSILSAKKIERYKDIMSKISAVLADSGFRIPHNNICDAIYVRAPAAAEYAGTSTRFSSACEFTKWMIKQLGIVTTFWDEVEPAVSFFASTEDNVLEEEEMIDLFRARMANVWFKFA